MSLDIGELILLVLALVIGLALTPVITESATAAAVNSSSVVQALVALVPFIYIAILIGGAALFLRDQYKHRR